MSEKKRALLSVSDKTGLADFAKKLVESGYELVSTGGTKKAIEEAGIPVLSISDVTNFPEIMDGRVKTLHPAVHSALLAKRDNEVHMDQLRKLELDTIDMVVVNLYPFQKTIAKPDVTEEDAIENIDIGGPTMLRAAAKNFQDVIVVVDPADYDMVAEGLQNDGLSVDVRKRLAGKVYRHTANYDAAIAAYFTEITEDDYPETYTATFEKVQSLRYGENPHQTAAFYKQENAEGTSLANAEQLNGKELSYNNIQDANAALEIVQEFKKPAAVAVKHMNPCGVGTGSGLAEAYQKAYEGDPVSIFGGIVAVNQEVDMVTAEKMKEIFLEIIIAPKFSKEALKVLTTKKNLRLLEVDITKPKKTAQKLTSVSGGLLVQDADTGSIDGVELEVATDREPTAQELEDLKLSWQVVKHVKSNAIVVAKADQTLGIGAGQMNRVGAAKIAFEQAGDKAKGAVMASDAFFPMPDTVEAAAEAGITAIIQPGGSKRDQDSIDACNQHGIAMVFTGMRHFKH
ncbi:bifunctional purine biosynthesis protein PurH [Thalassobacillus devorans]|uniref:Bifunctional purine biosynthesis protein PurH n=1 Tax=Thalassobacillus devorans TaxID=279813 RepID=A0ABQ1PJQ0_9BACI|nr:bifunctional phosphoribosylaminoimidazolecarboxamide formyltransferase/IMP cyclohydrolase [Thalassobacillus devorans]NIK30101.1 phosphoribosylaminoimidazolecarboxamide formyltransferase/IMP cyclohydrolase [Thalassobacillus devorans]GGC98352.1 bifunctional purine biosynthesis protein PurH [Thalassobacillus devorans]